MLIRRYFEYYVSGATIQTHQSFCLKMAGRWDWTDRLAPGLVGFFSPSLRALIVLVTTPLFPPSHKLGVSPTHFDLHSRPAYDLANRDLILKVPSTPTPAHSNLVFQAC